jgi:hypothetical protein
MNKYIRLVVLVIACVSWGFIDGYCAEGPTAPLGAQEERTFEKGEWVPDIAISTAFMTKYIWRGWNLGDEPVMQTDANISWYGFTFDFWTNYSFNNDKSKDGGRYEEFTEVDYTIDYTFNVGEMSEVFNIDTPDFIDPLTVSAGYIYYTFPNLDRDDKFYDSQEIYIGCSYDIFLQPFFTWYWDVGHGKGNSDGGGDGSYFLFGIGHTFEFEESGIEANLGLTAAVIDEQWTNKIGWGDMVLSGDVSIPFLKYFTVTPSVAYSVILNKDTYNGSSENEFYGGVTIGFEF